MVLGRGDDRHQLIAALGGLADRLHDHAIGFGVELAHELGELGVVRQHVVGADLVAEELFRRGDLWCAGVCADGAASDSVRARTTKANERSFNCIRTV